MRPPINHRAINVLKDTLRAPVIFDAAAGGYRYAPATGILSMIRKSLGFRKWSNFVAPTRKRCFGTTPPYRESSSNILIILFRSRSKRRFDIDCFKVGRNLQANVDNTLFSALIRAARLALLLLPNWRAISNATKESSSTCHALPRGSPPVANSRYPSSAAGLYRFFAFSAALYWRTRRLALTNSVEFMWRVYFVVERKHDQLRRRGEKIIAASSTPTPLASNIGAQQTHEKYQQYPQSNPENASEPS
jgi:hypothetical protein